MNPDVEEHLKLIYLKSQLRRYFENRYMGIHQVGDFEQRMREKFIDSERLETGYHVRLILAYRTTYIRMGATIEEACRFVAKLPPKS